MKDICTYLNILTNCHMPVIPRKMLTLKRFQFLGMMTMEYRDQIMPTTNTCSSHINLGNRAHKSRRTLQNKVRIKVFPEELTLFVNTFVLFKNALFNSLLLYRPDYCSEIHALSNFSKEPYCYKP